MNKLFLLALILINVHAVTHSQSPESLIAAKKWQGVWQGLAGGDSVTIYLIQASSPAEKDIKQKGFVGMYGWHSISGESKIKESSLQYASRTWNNNSTITGAYKKSSDSMHLVIKDLTRNRLLGAELILLNDREAILKTWLKETWRNDGKQYPNGQTFPKEIQLLRISTDVTRL